MDEVTRYNAARWKALAEADALFTRPHLELTPETARERVDPEGLLGELAGQNVLCLAGGGGQQSAAFALLGATVTVFDLSAEQLERDRQAAAHYNVNIHTVQGDMRDLSALESSAFDLVFQPYSLGFVPDCHTVFEGAARVIRPGGLYFVVLPNPFTQGLTGRDWNGEGYILRRPYVQGAEITIPDADWVYREEASLPPPPLRRAREYRQTLAIALNGLAAQGFVLIHTSDRRDINPDPDAEPGSWDHLVAFAPPWLAFWLRFQPA